MSNETTSTSLTERVHAEFIDPLIMDYTIDEMVIATLAYTIDISQIPTKTVSLTRWIKDAGGDITTEGTTDMSNTLLETTDVTATVAQVGILREVTDLAAASVMGGEQALVQFIAQDGAKLMAEMIDDDLAALATGFGTTAGQATTDLSTANLVEALNKRRTNNGRGAPAFVLDDQQTLDLSSALVDTTSTIFEAGANQSVLNGNSDGFLGAFLGVPVYYTNLTDSSNTGASVNGMLITTNASPAWASLALVMKWAPRLKSELDVSKLTTHYAISACYAVAERYDATGVKVKTDA